MEALAFKKNLALLLVMFMTIGMIIDFSLPGRVVFTMFGYLEDIILEAPADMRQKGNEDIPTPAIKVIFDVDELVNLLTLQHVIFSTDWWLGCYLLLNVHIQIYKLLLHFYVLRCTNQPNRIIES